MGDQTHDLYYYNKIIFFNYFLLLIETFQNFLIKK